MKLKRNLLIFFVVLLLFVPISAGTNIGGGFYAALIGEPGQVGGGFTASGDVASSVAQANGATNLEETRWVQDRFGNRAEVGLKVDNGNVIDYRTKISPREGTILAGLRLSAEEFLTVESADSIEAHAQAWSKKGTTNEKQALSKIEIKSDDGTASLSGYSNLAYVTTLNGNVGASQKIPGSSGDNIAVITEAKDKNQRSVVNIGISKKSGYGAEFNTGSTQATADSSTKAILEGGIVGTMNAYAEAKKGTQILTTSRTPGYGVEYRLLSEAATGAAGASLSNKLGYCIDDDRSETIAAAIADAWVHPLWHDTIYLAPGAYKGTAISKSVDVVGSGPDQTKVTGASSVFTVHPGVTTTIADMEITGGKAVYGGGIYNNEGTLTVRNCKIHENIATGTATTGGGGGIATFANTGTASTTVIDSEIYDNIVYRDESVWVSGGWLSKGYGLVPAHTTAGGGGIATIALSGSASTTLIGTKIYKNAIGKDYSANEKISHSPNVFVERHGGMGIGGAGIYNFADLEGASASTTVIDCEISDNTIVNRLAPLLLTQPIRNGGGIYNRANAGTASTMVIGSTISGNTIGDLAKGSGGGIANVANAGSASTTVIGSDIYSNTVSNTVLNPQTGGGGIYNYADKGTSSASITVTDSRIYDHTLGLLSLIGGGGICSMADKGLASATVTNSEIYSNTANTGAGIYNTETLKVDKSKIHDNTARTSGGGIYSDHDAQVTNSEIYSNTANGLLSGGGGIYNAKTLKVDKSNIHDNRAVSGGGIYNNADATVTNSEIHSNQVAVSGGGIYNARTLTVDKSNVHDNIALVSGGGIATVALTGLGSPASTTVTNSKITTNIAFTGGGLANIAAVGGASASTTVTNSDIRTNAATSGGGIYNFAGTDSASASTTVARSNLNLNAAMLVSLEEAAVGDGNGGGIWNNDQLVVDRSYVMLNIAETDGGGIWNSGDLASTLSWVTLNSPNNVANV